MSLKFFLLQWLVALTISPRVPEAVRLLQHQYPARTALMLTRVQEGKVQANQIRYQPVPLVHIAPILRKAVVLTEDGSFWQHPGYNLQAMQEAAFINLGHGKVIRGGSTITQQLSKNLFLNNKRTLNRKLKELLLAAYLEQALGKRRILELYLNVIEWGPGVFGIEAAARYHFHKSAADLNVEEIALLTSAIPFPLKARPNDPSPYHLARMNQVLLLLENRGVIPPGSEPY